MKELLYFSASDLMIQVSYKAEDNSIHYFSHRKLTFGERVIVEQYLLTNVAVKTQYYKKHPAILNYLGINGRLVKDLNQFHLKNTIKSLKDKEQEVEGSVRNLINQSMSNYYFERIGATLLQMRKSLGDSVENESKPSVDILKSQIRELVEAYNLYADKKVTVQEVIPRDLTSLIE